MAELRIHQERLDEDSIRQLIDICPFGAISCRDGKVEIDSGCRMCRLCVKKGPGGAVEYMETQEPGINKDEWRAVAVYVEYNGKAVHPVTFELIGKARELAAVTGHPVYALFMGYQVGEKAEELLAYGVDQVFVYDRKELEHFSVLTYANVFADFITRIRPSSILVGATNAGRSLAPRVAARFRTGLTADCTVLEMKENTDLVQIRPAFGGNIMAQIVTPKNRPQFCTVRYKIFSAPPVTKEPSGTIRTMEVTEDMIDRRIRVEEIIHKPKEIDISEAEVIVAVGRGVKSQADLEIIRELAAALDAQLACTRPLIECGWFDARRQIGLSGRTVKPKLIITIGISGSVQFAAGMRGAECIIAINTDRKAPVFDITNIGLVGDWYEILPRLLKTVKEGT
ncbi:electron transfer flavoprotein subunit alpha [Enterocloster bolteae]|uniref:electron transfer flavoprotein subunit alpha n=1 Tax=Enterocloster bolteae TaxID=208479 RepID=UPI002674E977|nr:electron transfer flavoprotein subunit alpha [Enterocloster bolteae]